MKYINEKDKYESPQVEIEEIMLVDVFCDDNTNDVSSIGDPGWEGCDDNDC
ncbi:MAG: hypothetical protein FWD66_04280 [Paludibacter sp.]|nr:hypothetical protein [Paludibacter sp.]